MAGTLTAGGNQPLLLDPATGKEAGRVDLPGAGGGGIMLGQASWAGNQVVSSIWIGDEQRLASFEADQEGLRLISTVLLPEDVSFGLNEPYLIGDGKSAAGWASNVNYRPPPNGTPELSPYLYVRCSFADGRCDSSAIGGVPGQMARKRNPSGGEAGFNTAIKPEER